MAACIRVVSKRYTLLAVSQTQDLKKNCLFGEKNVVFGDEKFSRRKMGGGRFGLRKSVINLWYLTGCVSRVSVSASLLAVGLMLVGGVIEDCLEPESLVIKGHFFGH